MLWTCSGRFYYFFGSFDLCSNRMNDKQFNEILSFLKWMKNRRKFKLNTKGIFIVRFVFVFQNFKNFLHLTVKYVLDFRFRWYIQGTNDFVEKKFGTFRIDENIYFWDAIACMRVIWSVFHLHYGIQPFFCCHSFLT